MSRQANLLQFLQSGKEVTASQIRGTFGIAHPGSAIRNLREQGFCVYTNTRTNSKGNLVAKYRIGVPSRVMVATAYRQGLLA